MSELPAGAGVIRIRPGQKTGPCIEVTMRDRLVRQMVSFLKKEDGPTAVEYAVMLALIIVVCIAAITTLGGNANATFSNVALNTGAS
jgi:pilus assembly protein Flp/PilA